MDSKSLINPYATPQICDAVYNNWYIRSKSASMIRVLQTPCAGIFERRVQKQVHERKNYKHDTQIANSPYAADLRRGVQQPVHKKQICKYDKGFANSPAQLALQHLAPPQMIRSRNHAFLLHPVNQSCRTIVSYSQTPLNITD